MKRFIRDFLQTESASGLFLFLSAIFAVVVANSPYALWHQQFIGKSLFFINDGLMTLFFFVIGLELKRGYLDGQLRRLSQIALPGLAALGGMLVPALLYLAFNWGDPHTVHGWATPVATDIAFALGVLSLFGKRVPAGLKLFLLALAIFDDLGAILIIALFYSAGLSGWMLSCALLLVIALFYLNKLGEKRWWVYSLFGVVLWVAVLRSGVHPTIAGVLLAFTMPSALLEPFEKRLHPWVAYLVMPLFAFVNMGFPLTGLSMAALGSPVVLGIMFGLFIGKQIGVMGFSVWSVRAGFAKLPEGVTWLSLYGAAALCGIGFTMSLFLGTLSFEQDAINLVNVRLGVLLGSLLSGLLGALILSQVLKPSLHK